MRSRASRVLVASMALVSVTGVVHGLEGVSPGEFERVVAIESRCPTFNWEAMAEASAYELEVYALPGLEKGRSLPAADVADGAERVLAVRIPGGATGWTPASDRCLAASGQYVWFVRGVRSADEGLEAGAWSRGRFFAVPGAPSAIEVERALEVLRRWQESQGLQAVDATQQPAETLPGAGGGRETQAAEARDVGNGSGLTLATAVAGLRAELSEGTGESYGVLGISASIDGAGLAGVNTGGGADLVLDGTADSAADTRLYEWGVDRNSALDETFTLRNTGTGSFGLHVVGDLSGDTITVDEVWVPTGMVIDDQGEWHGEGTILPCSGCVTASDIGDAEVTSAEVRVNAIRNSHLADDAVASAEILDGSIAAADLARGAVTSDKILDGTVVAVDLAAGSVGSSEIANGAIVTEDLAVGAVNSIAILDGAVGSSDIANGAIVTQDLAVGAVNSTAILDGTVAAADLAAGSVGSSEIVNGSIVTEDLAPGAVNSTAILDGTVAGADLATGSVGSIHIANGSVITQDLGIGSVTSSAVVDGTLTAVDVDATGGIYASKTSIYVNSASSSLSPGACTVVTASCSDVNDLPLQGTCECGHNGLAMARNTYAQHWDSATDEAQWGCEICRESSASGGSQDIYSRILCITVPGP